MFIKNSKVRKKRGRPRGETEQGAAARERLYKTATKLIAAHGYEATTLRDIAKKAEVSVGLLYRYFPSKEALVNELYRAGKEEFRARLERDFPFEATTRMQFHHTFLALVRFHRYCFQLAEYCHFRYPLVVYQ